MNQFVGWAAAGGSGWIAVFEVGLGQTVACLCFCAASATTCHRPSSRIRPLPQPATAQAVSGPQPAGSRAAYSRGSRFTSTEPAPACSLHAGHELVLSLLGRHRSLLGPLIVSQSAQIRQPLSISRSRSCISGLKKFERGRSASLELACSASLSLARPAASVASAAAVAAPTRDRPG
jgi:hypothetical protein